LAALAALLIGVYWLNLRQQAERDAKKAEEAKPVERKKGDDIVLTLDDVEQNQLEDMPAEKIKWREPVLVYGRLVPNPRSTSSVAAPFAGAVLADPSTWPNVGAAVRSGQTLGELVVRIGPQERLDVEQKLREARVKREGAEQVVAIMQERVKRLENSSVAATREREDARVSLNEALTNQATARATVDLYQAALDSFERGGNYRLPLRAPADGEVTEVAVRPGVAVEAGASILKIVDFRRPLAQVDLPPHALLAGPPAELELTMLPPTPGQKMPSSASLTAKLLGPAGQVEPTSQFSSFWYEARLPADAGGLTVAWRPGRFVRGELRLPAAREVDALSIPVESLLMHQGFWYVYVCSKHATRDRPAKYERREVQILGREGDRAIIAIGAVRGGANVVHRNAQTLLSEEFNKKDDD
jgi:biotin carboxyl carrier protein